MLPFPRYTFDSSGLEKRLAKINLNLSLQPDEKKKLLVHILSMTDLTSLEGTDNENSIAQLCRKAVEIGATPGFLAPVTVCIYPVFARFALNQLHSTGIKVAAVAGGFPSGQAPLHIKLDELKYALDQEAQEIEYVINRGNILMGRDQEVYDEIAAAREICGDITLKIILETGELQSVINIRKASEIAILAGADFLKTSTGKAIQGATPQAFLVMLDTIHEYLELTGKSVGIKASGGIRQTTQALTYYHLTGNLLGEQWLTKNYFRIGASSLAGEILKECSQS